MAVYLSLSVLLVLTTGHLVRAAPATQTYYSFNETVANWKSNNCNYPDSAFYEGDTSPLSACHSVLPKVQLDPASVNETTVLSQQLCRQTASFAAGVCEEKETRNQTLAALTKVMLAAAADYEQYDVCWFASGLPDTLTTYLPRFMQNRTLCEAVCSGPVNGDAEKQRVGFTPVCQFYISTLCKFVEFPHCVNPANPKPSKSDALTTPPTPHLPSLHVPAPVSDKKEVNQTKDYDADEDVKNNDKAVSGNTSKGEGATTAQPNLATTTKAEAEDSDTKEGAGVGKDGDKATANGEKNQSETANEKSTAPPTVNATNEPQEKKENVDSENTAKITSQSGPSTPAPAAVGSSAEKQANQTEAGGEDTGNNEDANKESKDNEKVITTEKEEDSKEESNKISTPTQSPAVSKQTNDTNVSEVTPKKLEPEDKTDNVADDNEDDLKNGKQSGENKTTPKAEKMTTKAPVEESPAPTEKVTEFLPVEATDEEGDNTSEVDKAAEMVKTTTTTTSTKEVEDGATVTEYTPITGGDAAVKEDGDKIEDDKLPSASTQLPSTSLSSEEEFKDFGNDGNTFGGGNDDEDYSKPEFNNPGRADNYPYKSDNEMERPGGASGYQDSRKKDDSRIAAEAVNPETPGSGHFFGYFLTAVVLCISGYIIFHNKQKIVAFIVEGRSAAEAGVSTRRRGGGPKYSQLKSNVEEVLPSLESATTTKNFVY